MNFRTTAILFGIVLTFGVILLVLNLTSEDTTPSGGIVEEMADAGLKADNVDTIVIERTDPNQTLKIVRTGKDSWKIEEPIDARADASAVDSAVSALFRAKPKEYPELSSNPSAHGLAPPGLRVTISGDGKSSTVNIGDLTFGSNAVAFITTSKRSRPMAVPASDLSPLFQSTRSGGKAGDLAKWTNDYRSKQIFTVEDRVGSGFENVAAVKVTVPNKKQEVAVSRSEDEWKFDVPAGWGEAAVTGPPNTATPSAVNGVRELVNAVLNLQASTAADFIDQPKDLKDYGLNRDNPDLIRVELKPKDGPPEVVYIGKREGNAPPPSTPGMPAPSGKVFVQIEGSPGVIKANASEKIGGLAAIAADPAPLRERDLLKGENKERVDAIDIALAGQTTKLRKTGIGWQLYGGSSDPTEAKSSAVSDILNLLYQPDIIKEFPAANDANFAGPEQKVEIKLWTGGIESGGDTKAEPKLKGNPTVLQFGKKDASGVYVRRTLPSGQKADFILPESVKMGVTAEPTNVLAAVTKNRLDFFEAPVQSFSAFQADKLTITQGKKTTEVVKDPSVVPNFPSGKWTFALPPEMKGVVADADLIRGDLLNFLAAQQPEKYVAEQATDEQLKQWQLDDANPRMKVTVGLNAGPEPKKDDKKDDKSKEKKAENRVYYFGTDTADGKSVHARQGESKVVYTVPKSLFEKFANADLRDKTLVRFDPAKVERIKIRGWTEATGQMLVREFKREGAGWTAIEPKGYNVDPAKIEQFLKDILALRAKEFRSGPPHPDHRFLPEQSGFEITLDLAAGEEDIILNIAAEVDNKASRIAKVDFVAMPPRTVLVTVPPDALKSYRDNAAAFAK